MVNSPTPFPTFEEIPVESLFVFFFGALLVLLIIAGLVFSWIASGKEDAQIVQNFMNDWEKLGDPEDEVELSELRTRVRAGKQLGAPTDHQKVATARREKELNRRTNRIKHRAGVSSSADFYGPRDDR